MSLDALIEAAESAWRRACRAGDRIEAAERDLAAARAAGDATAAAVMADRLATHVARAGTLGPVALRATRRVQARLADLLPRAEALDALAEACLAGAAEAGASLPDPERN